MGSPEFALPTLRTLHNSFNLVGVVSQPDRPAGRGKNLTPPPIKLLAQELDIPIIQPPRLRTPEAFEQLQAWHPDVIVVAAYGQILRQNILELPPFGCVNVHASLLPRWRGAAPINAAILHGDLESGITIMKMDAGVDTGPILDKKPLSIALDETAGTLSTKLANLGGEFLSEVLPKYLSGELSPTPQDDLMATMAPMLSKKDGQLDFDQPAEYLARQVRAYTPWPGTYMLWNDKQLKIHEVYVINKPGSLPGKRTILEGLPAISTTDGYLALSLVQSAGKNPTSGESFLRGARDWENQ